MHIYTINMYIVSYAVYVQVYTVTHMFTGLLLKIAIRT